jgi:choline-sulfatase
MTQSCRQFIHLGAAALGAQQKGRPALNLVFVTADQHSGLDLGCAGNKVVKTPRLDALARRGTVFTHTYTAGLICAPSRASVHTGLHVHAHGVYTNGIRVRQGIDTTAEILSRHGYRMHNAPLQARSNAAAFSEFLAAKGYSGSRDKAKLIPTTLPFRGRAGRSRR